jgi:hypothetical protein
MKNILILNLERNEIIFLKDIVKRICYLKAYMHAPTHAAMYKAR